MRTFDRTDIDGWEKRYRANLINSLSGFKSANLIGTRSAGGQENLALFSSVFHLGANPPLQGMISRPFTDTVTRHTFRNIQETGYYTINHVHRDFYEAAHQSSARYPDGQSEFEASGLHPEYLEDFPAPFVKESQIKLGMRLVEHQELLNRTILIIGSIERIYLPEGCVEQDGNVLLEKAGSVAVSGLYSYHQSQLLQRLPYAKAPQKKDEGA